MLTPHRFNFRGTNIVIINDDEFLGIIRKRETVDDYGIYNGMAMA